MSKKALMAISILLRRYPAAILLIVLNSIFTIWAIGAEKDASRLPLSLLYSSGLAIVFSAAGRLVADRFALKERGTLGLQVLVLLAFAALAWMFHDYGCFEEHFHYSYYLTLAAFSALTALAMSLRENPETVFPKLTFAGMMGFVAAIATGGGVALTVLAVEKLFGVKISYTVYEMVWGASFAAVALFAAHSHWNVVDVGVRAQKARLAEYVCQKSEGVEFDLNTRYSIMSTYEFICRYDDVNGRHREIKRWLEKEETDRFKKEWGFSFIPRWERERSQDVEDRQHFNFRLKDRRKSRWMVFGRFADAGSSDWMEKS